MKHARISLGKIREAENGEGGRETHQMVWAQMKEGERKEGWKRPRPLSCLWKVLQVCQGILELKLTLGRPVHPGASLLQCPCCAQSLDGSGP